MDLKEFYYLREQFKDHKPMDTAEYLSHLYLSFMESHGMPCDTLDMGKEYKNKSHAMSERPSGRELCGVSSGFPALQSDTYLTLPLF